MPPHFRGNLIPPLEIPIGNRAATGCHTPSLPNLNDVSGARQPPEPSETRATAADNSARKPPLTGSATTLTRSLVKPATSTGTPDTLACSNASDIEAVCAEDSEGAAGTDGVAEAEGVALTDGAALAEGAAEDEGVTDEEGAEGAALADGVTEDGGDAEAEGDTAQPMKHPPRLPPTNPHTARQKPGNKTTRARRTPRSLGQSTLFLAPGPGFALVEDPAGGSLSGR